MSALVKFKDNLVKQDYVEIQKFNLDSNFLQIRDRRATYHVQTPKMKNCEISFWINDGKIYSIIYIVHDNTCVYDELYNRRGIMPKAVCENRADGGYLYRNYPEESKERNALLPFPEYILGQTGSIANAEQYVIVSEKIEYLGEYGAGYLCLRRRIGKDFQSTTANKRMESNG